MVRLRERERDVAAESFKQAQYARQKLLLQVDELLEEHASQVPLQSDSIAGQVNPQRLLESQRYQMQLLQEVAQLKSQIQLVEAECEKRRLTLVKHEQNVSSLEKLRSKQQAEWEADRQRLEQLALDQWAGFRYWKVSPSPRADLEKDTGP